MRASEVAVGVLTGFVIWGCSAGSPAGRRGELGVFVGQRDDSHAQAANGDNEIDLVPRLATDTDNDTDTAKAGDEELRARIQNVSGIELDIVTISCAGACADIVAVAHGGNPPYTVKWDDGSITASRHVCLQHDETLTVEVTDTPIASAEFSHEARTTVASVTAKVLQCPAHDADAAAADGGGSPVELWCQPADISRQQAAQCQLLELQPACDDKPEQTRSAELPFSLSPGTHSCVVAFGTTGPQDSQLSLTVASIERQVSAISCRGSSQHLGEENTKVVRASNGELLGRVVCLSNPTAAWNELLVAPLFAGGTLGAVELRICEQCPAEP